MMTDAVMLALTIRYMPLAILWAQAFLWILRAVQAILWPLRIIAVHGLVAGSASIAL